jgi:hypothetical protein
MEEWQYRPGSRNQGRPPKPRRWDSPPVSIFDCQWPARHGEFADSLSFREPPGPEDDALPVLHAAASRGAWAVPETVLNPC